MNELQHSDWQLLKGAILQASALKSPNRGAAYHSLPASLKNHPAGLQVAKSLESGKSTPLNKAAKLITNGAANAWLILEKS